ncbi:MAG: alpha-galactosidase [Clostridia bacterium]|nr:alpha-galactosidase [Clostridia bacterium]
MYTIKANEQFEARLTERQLCDGITILTVEADCKTEPSKLELRVDWTCDDIGVNVSWSPSGFLNKIIRPNWGGFTESSAMSSAPVFSNVGYDDSNRLTIACSDPKNRVRIRSGVIEENARLSNTVVINVDCAIDHYKAEIRLDTRDIPFYKAVEDVAKWWETFEGLEPTNVPDTARQPLYSAWYSFHQQIDVPRIIEECRYFGALGCKAIIIDDGWQTDDNSRGYAYCGDWEVAASKIPDMKAFVDAVHETGLKFMLWYSVPFVGIHSKAYERFKDKTLANVGMGGTYVLDPRYPDVREYLIGIYKKAVLDWGLDGFKLDFIDSFRQSAEVKEGMDYVSVYDAVDRLMKDVISTLKELNPDILIEFRQSYIGPLMRTFGNMLRAADCPNDSYSNRVRTLALRMTSGNTAVHSDMVMWSYNEPVELAAFQLNHILFAVPQISVLHDKMPEDHAKMVGYYLSVWEKYRSVLLDGEMLYKGYAADYNYASARKDNTQVGAVYSGRIAYLEHPTDEIVLVNASMNKDILIDSSFGGYYSYTITDCMGNEVSAGKIVLGGAPAKISVPVSGYITLNRI